MKRLALLFAALFAAAPGTAAQAFAAVVTYVTDGDTVWVRPEGRSGTLELRLLDIDAPESCQAFGAQAKQALHDRVLHRRVQVQVEGTDDYGRQLARVHQGREDVAAWLVRRGYAWSGSFRGRPGRYARLQAQARAARLGLWALPGALEPRRFRQRFGRCQ